MKGISTNETLSRKTIQDLKNSGISFVFRYYCTDATKIPEKILQPKEAAIYAAENLQVGVVYEFGGGAPRGGSNQPHPEDFDPDKAERDAKVALKQAEAVGQPKGTAIYFAVDHDFTSPADLARIYAYFQRIAGVFKASSNGSLPYKLGVYGSGMVCRTVKVECPDVTLTWLAESTGWSESKTFTDWSVKQSIAKPKQFDLNYEDCDAPADFGGFVPTPAQPLSFDEVSEKPFVPLAGPAAAPSYPGRLIKRDGKLTSAIRTIQRRLRDLGYTEPDGNGGRKPLDPDGIFGANTEDAVELFQIRHTDINGLPLVVDGEVGEATWAALFGGGAVAVPVPATAPYISKVLEIAEGEIGVMEVPPGSNAGKRVEEYQNSVGISKGDPWCVAFEYFCFEAAATELGVSNPLTTKCKTGGVLDLWNRARKAKVKTITQEEALDSPSKIQPGMLFIISTGGGNGHTGFVVRRSGKYLITIEGNTNDGGSREGIGVFRRTGRTISSINRGFIDFGGD